MYQHATLYLARPLDLAGLSELLAGRAEVAVRPDRFAELVGGGITVVASSMPVAEIGQHLDGLRGYLRARCVVTSADLPRRVDEVRQVLGLVIDPGFRHGDEVWRWLTAMARAGAGMIFLAGAFLDDRSQPLAGPPGLTLVTSGEPDVSPRQPPTAERVRRRAWALAAVAERGFLEAGDGEVAGPRLDRMRRWIELSGIRTELEPAERALIDSAVGAAHARQVIDATWRSEGLLVLAWALGAVALPSHEEPCDFAAVASAVGFLADDPTTISGELRADEELDRIRRRHLALHWRVREHRLNVRPVDLVKLSQSSFLGGFDLFGVAVVERDLAVGGQAITRADPDRLRSVTSIALERHHASNWLRGDDPIYSLVTTPT